LRYILGNIRFKGISIGNGTNYGLGWNDFSLNLREYSEGLITKDRLAVAKESLKNLGGTNE
jgi:hypothetical protein